VSDAARSLGLELHIMNVTNKEDIDQVFATAARLGVAGIVMATDAFLNTHGEELATLALRYRMPAIFQTRAFAAAGGLMSYGGDASEAYYQAGAYTARVLKGEKPADLPVQQTTKVELVVNSKTAKALGIDIPLSLIGRANEVIE
jgi:putative ABC transport system substrate-binding protein